MKEKELEYEVEKLNIEDGDYVVFSVDVGNMSISKAIDYLSDFRQRLKDSEFLPKDVPVLVTTKRVDVKAVSKEEVEKTQNEDS